MVWDNAAHSALPVIQRGCHTVGTESTMIIMSYRCLYSIFIAKYPPLCDSRDAFQGTLRPVVNENDVCPNVINKRTHMSQHHALGAPNQDPPTRICRLAPLPVPASPRHRLLQYRRLPLLSALIVAAHPAAVAAPASLALLSAPLALLLHIPAHHPPLPSAHRLPLTAHRLLLAARRLLPATRYPPLAARRAARCPPLTTSTCHRHPPRSPQPIPPLHPTVECAATWSRHCLPHRHAHTRLTVTRHCMLVPATRLTVALRRYAAPLRPACSHHLSTRHVRCILTLIASSENRCASWPPFLLPLYIPTACSCTVCLLH
jgi:hypothetical protein